MRAKLSKWGNSLAVRIPSLVARELEFEEGTMIGIEAVGGALHIRRAAVQMNLDALVDGITDCNRHTEADWGSDLGNEAW